MESDSSRESVREGLQTFIQEQLAYDPASFDPNADLMEAGIIDSLTLLRLVTFMEEHYQIKIRDLDIVPENFSSLDALEALVERARKNPN